MYVVYRYNHPKSPGVHFISAVCRKFKDAKIYLKRIPEELRKTHEIVKLSQKSYPVYFIDKNFYNEPARPVSREMLAEEINLVNKTWDSDHVYFNYYRFEEDYFGVIPGEDNMGSTDHTHVDNDYIVGCIEAAIERGEMTAKKVSRSKT